MEPTADARDLHTRYKQQEGVAELGQRALETDDLEVLMYDTCSVVVEALETEYATVLELTPGGEAAILRAGVGWSEGSVGEAQVSTDPDTLAGFTLRSEAPIIVDDLQTETRFTGPDLLTSHDVVSGICGVIGSPDEPWGVFGTYTSERREFADHDANFAQSVANVLAAAIDRSSKERQLERYRAYTDEILASVDDIFYVVDGSGNFRRWNDRLNDVSGYSDEEIRSMTPFDFFPEEDHEVIARGIAEAFETGKARLEATAQTKAGEGIPYEFSASTLETPDGDLVLAGIGRDVSEQKERERELVKYETIVETIDDGIYVKDDENRFIMVNESYAELTGYTREELIGAHASLVVDEATIEQARERRAEQRDRDEASPTMEAMIERPDGSTIPAEGTFATIELEDGTIEQIGVVRDITERKRAEAQLRESEERFRNLMMQSPLSIQLFDADGRTIAVNPAWERLWNASKEELAGYNVLQDEQLEAAGVLSDIRRAFSGEQVTLPITYYDPAEIGKPGRARWIEGFVYPLLSEGGETFEVALVHHDVTELKVREQELERYEMAVETVWDGITILDSDDRFVLVNEAFCEITGYDSDEVIGQHATLVLDDDTYERAAELHDEVVDGAHDIATLEYDLITADGGTVPVEARFGPVEYADGTVGGAGVIRDVTDRNRRKRELEESNRRLEQFAYAASHDLQEPLRMISSYLSLLERRYEGELDEDATEFIAFAVDGADRMRTMISGLLEYSRVETQGNPLEPVDLNEVLEDALANLQVRIDERDAEITTESLPRVRGDQRQLEQVFQNLLSNAIEYTDDEPPRIRVGAESTGRTWTIWIRDEGIGIDPDDTERVFEIFQRLHSREEHDGSGIGLALCQRIAERHGGEIWIDSEPGDGTTVSFTLPVAGP